MSTQKTAVAEKRSPGRPASFPDQETENMSVFIPIDTCEGVRLLAAKKKETKASIVDRALRALLSRSNIS